MTLASVGFTRLERTHPESVKDGRFTVHAWR
jgi:hypothetical protein